MTIKTITMLAPIPTKGVMKRNLRNIDVVLETGELVLLINTTSNTQQYAVVENVGNVNLDTVFIIKNK